MTDICRAGPAGSALSDEWSGERRGGRCSSAGSVQRHGWNQRTLRDRRRQEPQRPGNLVPSQGEFYKPCDITNFLLKTKQTQPKVL